jgi:hypothetical protein
MFPGGVEVRSDRGLDEAIRVTRELVANPKMSAIYEGVFEDAGVLVRVDVLHRRRDSRWRLIEVKSTTEVKEHHLDDLGIQYRVVSRSGLDVASACLAHINRNYVFKGGCIDVRRFFRIRNLTRRVGRLQPKLTFRLRSEFVTLECPQRRTSNREDASHPDCVVGISLPTSVSRKRTAASAARTARPYCRAYRPTRCMTHPQTRITGQTIAAVRTKILLRKKCGLQDGLFDLVSAI